jgi:hypothetical protein
MSTDLQMMLQSKMSDPRFGDTTTTLVMFHVQYLLTFEPKGGAAGNFGLRLAKATGWFNRRRGIELSGDAAISRVVQGRKKRG